MGAGPPRSLRRCPLAKDDLSGEAPTAGREPGDPIREEIQRGNPVLIEHVRDRRPAPPQVKSLVKGCLLPARRERLSIHRGEPVHAWWGRTS